MNRQTAMPCPLISIVIPSYNRAHYLPETIASALRQTYPAKEIIVVDDGSTDNTAEVLAAYADKLSYIRQANRGIGAARNAGVARAAGEFVAFLDDDDLWVPNKLELQMRVFFDRPETDAVYGHAEQFISPDLDASSAAKLRHLDGKVQAAPIPCSLLIRRASFERVGPFDETLCLGVEVDWYARLSDLGLKTVMLADTLYRRRLHSSNTNRTHANEQSERLRALKMALDRRRKTAAQSG